MMMTAWLAWALYFLLTARLAPAPLPRLVGFYLCVAGALATKGPAALMALGAALAVVLVEDGWRRGLRWLRLPVGIGILALASLPWLLPYLLQTERSYVGGVVVGHYGDWYFRQKPGSRLESLQENLVRFTAGSGKRIPSGAFFLLPALRDGFPWSVLFCFGLWNFSRHAPVREKGVFALIWWFVVLIFFSVSAGKRDVYLLPAYPAMALFAAEWGWPFVTEQTRPLPTILRTGLRVIALSLAVLVLTAAASAASGRLTVDAVWLDWLLGQDKWDNVAIYIRFLAQQPIYGVSLFVALCAGGAWAVYVGTAGRWRAALWVVLLLLVLDTISVYPFTRAYAKEFKAFTGFAAALQQTVGANKPFFFYTPESYSAEFDEFSQVYFYLNRHVPLAPCAEQPDFARCAPGYYLLRDRHWQLIRTTPNVRQILDSQDSAGPDAPTRLILVRLF